MGLKPNPLDHSSFSALTLLVEVEFDGVCVAPHTLSNL